MGLCLSDQRSDSPEKSVPLQPDMAKRVIVTGGNTGIGFALCRQLAAEHGCHVYLGSRSVEKGQAAVKSILDALPSAKCEMVQVDTNSDESVKAAAETVKASLGAEKLYAIVNNAGMGLATGNETQMMISTNLYGPKRMCDAFMPLLDASAGRIVNVCSGAGPAYVKSSKPEVKRQLCKEDQTWEEIEAHLKSVDPTKTIPGNGYGLSKALLTNYTSALAKQHPNIKINGCSPGFIETNMTSGFGASKGPEEGTVAIKHLLFGELTGNGWYYGSDAVRSPLHFMRNPGEPEYDGVVPEFATRVLVTGGNTGIGFALCRQLAAEHGCHVYLGSRSVEKGQAAVKAILDKHPSAKVELVQVDTGSDESVKAAAESVKALLKGDTLYAVVNNAGTGLSHGVDANTTVNVNLFGPKRMCEAFIPMLSTGLGRIVNVGSGAGPMYVGGCSADVRKKLCSEDQTWEDIEAHLKSVGDPANTPMGGYGLSKALLTNYTSFMAKKHPALKINCCSPGYIDTAITKNMGASKTPEEGTVAIKHLLFEELSGNGWYYGSDAVRSPLHFMRNPGQPAYDGVVPDF